MLIAVYTEQACVFEWAKLSLQSSILHNATPELVWCSAWLAHVPAPPACVLLEPLVQSQRGYAALQLVKLAHPGSLVVLLNNGVVDNHLNEADAVIPILCSARLLYETVLRLLGKSPRPLAKHDSYPPPALAQTR